MHISAVDLKLKKDDKEPTIKIHTMDGGEYESKLSAFYISCTLIWEMKKAWLRHIKKNAKVLKG